MKKIFCFLFIAGCLLPVALKAQSLSDSLIGIKNTVPVNRLSRPLTVIDVNTSINKIVNALYFIDTSGIFKTDTAFTKNVASDTANALRVLIDEKQDIITPGSISNAQLANGAVANLSGTNTGDNAANSTYSSDYRAANFIAGTNYLAPAGSGAALTGLTKSQVGLGSADNTSDADKPISSAAQTALDGKQATLVSATNIKTINGSSVLGSGDLVVSGTDATKLAIANNLSDLNNAATARTNIGLSTTFNIANSSDKNFVTDANLTVINNTSGTNTGDNAANSTYSSDYRAANFIAGTNYLAPAGSGAALTGLTKSQVGLGSADNTSDANKPVSTAQQTALDLKANLASPAFTGTPTGIGIPVYAQVTGSNATTTGQALVDVTGLSVALTTNAIYEFEAVMTGSTSAVTTGTAYGVNYSVAGGAIEASISGASTATAMKSLRITALNTATALYLAGSAQTGGIIIKGRLTTGVNAGNLTIKHLKLTSGTSTVFIGSFLKVTRIS